jgi:hypothetical protein
MSRARGETEMDGETNLAAELDPAARMDLLQLTKRGGAAHLRAIWQSDGPFCPEKPKGSRRLPGRTRVLIKSTSSQQPVVGLR